jgi:hypothetical protein
VILVLTLTKGENGCVDFLSYGRTCEESQPLNDFTWYMFIRVVCHRKPVMYEPYINAVYDNHSEPDRMMRL